MGAVLPAFLPEVPPPARRCQEPAVVSRKTASKGQAAAQRAQAQCAVDYDAVCLSPAVHSWRDDDAGAPTAPKDGEDGLAARQPESVIGPSPRMEAHAQVLVQAHGARDQTHAAWREVEAKLQDEILLRHDSPKTLQAYAGWLRKFRGFIATTPPAEVTGAEAKRFVADLAVRRQVSAAAQHQAFNALLFLFRQVLTQELGDLSDTPRAKRSTSIPTVLSRQEVERLLAALNEPYP
jgi:Phage integrase, N-terminal SAM-like domain